MLPSAITEVQLVLADMWARACNVLQFLPMVPSLLHGMPDSKSIRNLPEGIAMRNDETTQVTYQQHFRRNANAPCHESSICAAG